MLAKISRICSIVIQRPQRRPKIEALLKAQFFLRWSILSFSVSPVASSEAGERKNPCLSQSPQGTQSRPRNESPLQESGLLF